MSLCSDVRGDAAPPARLEPGLPVTAGPPHEGLPAQPSFGFGKCVSDLSVFSQQGAGRGHRFVQPTEEAMLDQTVSKWKDSQECDDIMTWLSHVYE